MEIPEACGGTTDKQQPKSDKQCELHADWPEYLSNLQNLPMILSCLSKVIHYFLNSECQLEVYLSVDSTTSTR